jgi:hypothetical protein
MTEDRTVSVEVVAKALNVTRFTVARFAREGMPRAGRGRYQLGPCMLWYIEYLHQALERRSQGEGAHALAAARLRALQARVKGMCMANERIASQLLPRQYAVWFMVRMGQALERGLAAMEARVGNDLAAIASDPAACRERLLKEVRQVRTDVADWIHGAGEEYVRHAKRKDAKGGRRKRRRSLQ